MISLIHKYATGELDKESINTEGLINSHIKEFNEVLEYLLKDPIETIPNKAMELENPPK